MKPQNLDQTNAKIYKFDKKWLHQYPPEALLIYRLSFSFAASHLRFLKNI